MQSPVSRHNDALPERTDRLLVIVGGGSFDGDLLQRLAADGALVVGADGGADAALVAGVTPELVIGDLDSLSDPEAWKGRTRVVRLPEQLTADFEKCLYSVKAPMTVALGMTGKRFDHTLAALHAVTRYGAARRIILVDEVDAALTLGGPVTLDVPVGTRISVYPLAEVRFAHSDGLSYPLDGLTLAAGVRVGTSNEAVAETVRIVPEPGQTGTWLLVLPLEFLPQLLSVTAE